MKHIGNVENHMHLKAVDTNASMELSMHQCEQFSTQLHSLSPSALVQVQNKYKLLISFEINKQKMDITPNGEGFFSNLPIRNLHALKTVI